MKDETCESEIGVDEIRGATLIELIANAIYAAILRRALRAICGAAPCR